MRGAKIKDHGIRWRLALVGALLHGMRTGHKGEWTIEVDERRAWMRCPVCSRRVRVLEG